MHTVIIGAGFGGLRAMRHLAKDRSQKITLIDRHDYNFFPPLIYQVVAGFLSAPDISYPLRKYVSKDDNVHYRQGILQRVDTQRKVVILDSGEVEYQRLILAIGAESNYFGNANIEKFALPMKRLGEALHIRSHMLQQFNHAATVPESERAQYLKVVIAGGGPSGVELAGVLSEIRNEIFAKEYPEFGGELSSIDLVTADAELLKPMSETSQCYAKEKLEQYGVNLTFSDPVADYDGTTVRLVSGKTIKTKTMVWTAGVRCVKIDGFNDEDFDRGNRLFVDENLRLAHYDDVYALGDIAVCHHDKNFPNGHPQLGQVAMSQGIYLGKNLCKKKPAPFQYKHRGNMAMIGRLKAVADIEKRSFTGFTAWIAWVWIHIISLSTNKNRISTFFDWMIAFFTHNQSMRMGALSYSAEETSIHASTSKEDTTQKETKETKEE